MQTITLMPGTTILCAAKELVRHAPARADFNGIMIRARYATTRPRDIVDLYCRKSDERAEAWRRSPEGRWYEREREERQCAAQATAESLIDALPSVDMNDAAAVLAWLDRMVSPADTVGVIYDHDALVFYFQQHDWRPGVNCGDDFNENDARNYAGWIVGQWLHCRWPGVRMFIERWHDRFGFKTAS